MAAGGRFLFGGDDVAEIVRRDGAVVTALLKGDAEDLARFGGGRLEVGVDLDYRVFATFFIFENLERGRLISPGR